MHPFNIFVRILLISILIALVVTGTIYFLKEIAHLNVRYTPDRLTIRDYITLTALDFVVIFVCILIWRRRILKSEWFKIFHYFILEMTKVFKKILKKFSERIQ